MAEIDRKSRESQSREKTERRRDWKPPSALDAPEAPVGYKHRWIRESVMEYDDKNNNVITTVGQLNFFRWALESNVIDYVDKNLDNIEEDMNSCIRNNYGKKKKQPEQKEIKNIVSKTRRKRQSLSVSATKSINRHNVQITVSFE